jgi:2-phospho-L-lactate guanylyltransferase
MWREHDKMKINILIPIKKLNETKSRLIKYLDENSRITLTLLMLEDILESCISSQSINKIYLVSYDDLSEFKKYKEIEILINKEELNKALEFALDYLRKEENDATLIIPSDLPLIEPIDISNLGKLIENYEIILGPSCDGGTNILMLRNYVKINLEFGEGKTSFLLHLKNALDNNYNVTIYSNERICLDLDDIIRFKYFKTLNSNKKSIKYIKELANN